MLWGRYAFDVSATARLATVYRPVTACSARTGPASWQASAIRYVLGATTSKSTFPARTLASLVSALVRAVSAGNVFLVLPATTYLMANALRMASSTTKRTKCSRSAIPTACLAPTLPFRPAFCADPTEETAPKWPFLATASATSPASTWGTASATTKSLQNCSK